MVKREMIKEKQGGRSMKRKAGWMVEQCNKHQNIFRKLVLEPAGFIDFSISFRYVG